MIQIRVPGTAGVAYMAMLVDVTAEHLTEALAAPFDPRSNPMMRNPGTPCDPDGRAAQPCPDADCTDCVYHRIVCALCWPAPSGDILATIDAATAGICACGCARTLGAADSSMWFATAICQAVWNGRRALDVGGVFDRPDADELLDDDIDAMPAPMNRHRFAAIDDPVPDAPSSGRPRPGLSPFLARRVVLLPAGVRLDDVFEGAAELSVVDLNGGIDLSPWATEADVFIGDGPDPFAGYRHPHTDHVHVSFRQR